MSKEQGKKETELTQQPASVIQQEQIKPAELTDAELEKVAAGVKVKWCEDDC